MQKCNCDLCNKNTAEFEYTICDGSKINICSDCHETLEKLQHLFGKSIEPPYPDRLINIVWLILYIEYSKAILAK